MVFYGGHICFWRELSSHFECFFLSLSDNSLGWDMDGMDGMVWYGMGMTGFLCAYLEGIGIGTGRAWEWHWQSDWEIGTWVRLGDIGVIVSWNSLGNEVLGYIGLHGPGLDWGLG
jgi:hypothetical protein